MTMLFAMIDQMPATQKLMAHGLLGFVLAALILMVALRFWNAMRGD